MYKFTLEWNLTAICKTMVIINIKTFCVYVGLLCTIYNLLGITQGPRIFYNLNSASQQSISVFFCKQSLKIRTAELTGYPGRECHQG